MTHGADPGPHRVAGGGEPRVPTTRIAPRAVHDLGTWWLMLGALVLVALAIAKPWGSGPRGTAGAEDDPAAGRIPQAQGAAGTPPPTPMPTAPSADDLAATRCNDPLGWRTYAIETWRGQAVRSFIVVDPLAAPQVTDPYDPRLPAVPLIGEAITAVGYCAPTTEQGRPPAGVAVRIWRADASGGLRALAVPRIEPARPSSLMALFAYSSDEDHRRAPWPAGRYLLGILGPAASEWGRWFAFDVVRVVDGSTP